MDEFSKLPETTLHGLKQTGDGEFQATMRDALTFVKQVWQQVITPKAFRHDYDVTLTVGFVSPYTVLFTSTHTYGCCVYSLYIKA